MSEPPTMYNGKVVKNVEPFIFDGDDSLPYYTTPRLLAPSKQESLVQRTPRRLTRNDLKLIVIKAR